MTDSEWPKYLPLPRDHFHALGVIAATFNSLETKLLGLFILYLGVGATTMSIFDRLRDNAARIDLLKKATAERAETPEIADAVDYFCKGFSRCAENRNILMHSYTKRAYELSTGEGVQTVLRKLAKGGQKWNEFSVSPTELRNLADASYRIERYGLRIYYHVVGAYRPELINPPGSIPLGEPLPKKPPLPDILSPQDLPEPADE